MRDPVLFEGNEVEKGSSKMSFFCGAVRQKMRTPAAAVSPKAEDANSMVAEGLISFAEGSFKIAFLVYLVCVAHDVAENFVDTTCRE